MRRHWYPITLTVLTLGTIAAFLANLTANGWANSFYAAAVQAGSEDWEAFLFGSLDSANAITVDKPPASLWLMALSARLFGFSSFSMLLPQVLLAGVSVLLIVHSVRLSLRSHVGSRLEKAAALVAGVIFAVSPVVALMFRFNNPDALLVTLMIGAVVATQHALRSLTEAHRRRSARRIVGWLVLAGVCLGLGFLTKQFQVLLIVPGLAVAWVLFARTSRPRRLLWLLVPLGSMIVSAGWWIALVELTPAGSRPYIGGSQSNSFLELTFGYNGFGRLTGNETGSVGAGGGGQGGGWGETGITRLFTGSFGQQVSWFLPTALFLLAVTIVLLILAEAARRRRVPTGTDRSVTVGSTPSRARKPNAVTDDDRAVRASGATGTGSLGAGLLMWGAWLIVTWLVLSNMNGIVHEYYTVALIPAIAAVIGLGVAVLLARDGFLPRLLLAAAWALTGAWQFIISSQMTGIPGVLRWCVLIASILGALVLIVIAHRRIGTALASVLVALAILGSAAIPAQLAVRTIAGTAQGSIVTIVGTSSGMGGGPGGGGMPGGGARPGGGAGGTDGTTVGTPGGTRNSEAGTGGTGGMPGGAGGGMGGLLGASEPSDELTQLLEQDASDYTWVAATTGANQAAGYQLSLEEPVMAIGGFNGTDPSPTLSEFKQLVADGKIHYYIGSGSGGGQGPGGGSDSASSQIAAWVEANYEATTVDSVSLYDLSAG
ncbi:4-amino-4-deoxy-L-arabinose transferase [Brevibacterium iodinum ATCC 49514]|uniref:4-amino-4-deoxy-L-arabinose transferase n=1 Tax=Brevibacterium iodinum ATCC 49514 TaxID=1255616 RepID=A0A2H1K1Z1_9MICO|nr:glycosyltransferase family 39 protein [Brevibacterium iodinum]SMX93827.1 4-amino-4-deoxy-L-arabinose transferase [Brevibacterium iodinum ATCC 49514]SUW11614.1 4-amino-4-deoxy-L-arabinose transferase [Brevibacterium iodinum]